MDCSDKGNYQKQTCYNLKLLLKKKMAVVVLPDLLLKKFSSKLDLKLFSSDLLCRWSIMCNFKDKIRL